MTDFFAPAGSTSYFTWQLQRWQEESDETFRLLRLAHEMETGVRNIDIRPRSMCATSWQLAVKNDYINIADFYGLPELPGGHDDTRATIERWRKYGHI